MCGRELRENKLEIEALIMSETQEARFLDRKLGCGILEVQGGKNDDRSG